MRRTWVYLVTSAFSDGAGDIIAHELAHGMGALTDGMPHENDDNEGHAYECGDLMCYGGLYTPSETWNNGCGTKSAFDNYNSIYRFRMDCNGDDYFNPAATWDSSRWAVHNSAFLWNPPGSQPLVFPTAPPSQTDVVE